MGNQQSILPTEQLSPKRVTWNKPLPALPASDVTSIPLAPRAGSGNPLQRFTITEIEKQLTPPPTRQHFNMENEEPWKKLPKLSYMSSESLDTRRNIANNKIHTNRAAAPAVTALPRARSEFSLLKPFHKAKKHGNHDKSFHEQLNEDPREEFYSRRDFSRSSQVSSKPDRNEIGSTLLASKKNPSGSVSSRMRGILHLDNKSEFLLY